MAPSEDVVNQERVRRRTAGTLQQRVSRIVRLGGLMVMITSGAVMNWAVWGVFATVGSYFFLMLAGGRRKR